MSDAKPGATYPDLLKWAPFMGLGLLSSALWWMQMKKKDKDWIKNNAERVSAMLLDAIPKAARRATWFRVFDKKLKETLTAVFDDGLKMQDEAQKKAKAEGFAEGKKTGAEDERSRIVRVVHNHALTAELRSDQDPHVWRELARELRLLATLIEMTA